MLKTVLESLDGLDEAVVKLYSQTDDKFILQIDGVDLHPDVATLKNAYERVKEDKANLSSERDALKDKIGSIPEDFDVDIWAKAKEGKADEAKLAELRGAIEAKALEAEKRAVMAEAKLSQFAVERDLSDALTQAGVTDPALAKGATAILSNSVKTNEKGHAYVETDMGDINLGEYIKKWVAGDGKSFVSPAKGSGRSGGESSLNNTKKWSEMTSSEKVALNKTNPEEYARIKAAG